MINSGIYMGTISEVYPPNHQLNDSNGYQYVYEVVVATDMYAYLPVRCIKMDATGGGIFNYEDIIFTTGQQVFIGFPFSDTARGVIIGGEREEPEPVGEDGGIRWKKRFNEINQSVSFKGLWKVEHSSTLFSSGPSISLDKDVILINDGGPTGRNGDSLAQSVEIDARNNTIKIKSGTWTLDALNGVTINVTSGNVEINCISTELNAKNKIDIKSNADIQVTSKAGNVQVTAGLQAVVDAPKIMLNSKKNPLDGVITMTTQPTCYVTGIPFQGSKTVFAGP